MIASYAQSQSFTVSQEEWTLFDSARQRPIKAFLWYPSHTCSADAKCLAPSAKVATPILLSHGSMGSPLEYSWLANALADAGYIVVGIAHFGESWVYGPDSLQPQQVPQFWLRARDCQFVLDALQNGSMFDRPVAWHNTLGIGHSAGGQTMLSLAGVRFSSAQIAAYCQTAVGGTDKGCAYGKQVVPNAAFIQAFGQSYKDARITRVIALDPALGPAATVESLEKVAVPTLIIGALHNDFLPFAAHSAYYAEHLPQAQLHRLTGDEGHFVFLNPCTHLYQAQGVALCKDAESVDRAQTHRDVLAVIVPFLNRTAL